MNSIRKFLGYLWTVLGPAIIILMIYRAFQELATVKPEKIQETILFWIITITIFVPIAFGLTIFGLYAIKGEYNQEA